MRLTIGMENMILKEMFSEENRAYVTVLFVV